MFYLYWIKNVLKLSKLSRYYEQGYSHFWNNILRKRLWCAKFLIIYCSVVYSLNFTKNGIHVRPFWRSSKCSDWSTRKHSWRNVLFSKVPGLEFVPVILLKTDSTVEIFQHGFCKICTLKDSKNFMKGIFATLFLIKVLGSIDRLQLYWKWCP